MTEPENTPDRPSGGNDSAAALLAVLDAYLADLQAGKAPDRAAVLAAHPELAPRLESCLAAIDFIHRAERTDPAVPQTLGEFRIVREIGRGAMGVVYEAEQVSLKRRVALKVLRFGAAPDAEAMARFRREAETVAALHHTNIVPLFAAGTEAGVHFFAMQLIAGRSLAAVLEEATRAGGPPDAKTVAGWGVQAAEALAHAHARGVVHRDVKPSNLLLDGEGTVWLTDFGLARRSDEATLTTAGVLLGTPRYMSPEQAAAARTPVDQRSDVYSLGATLYELATGKPVFEAESAGQLLEQIATAEPVPPRRYRPDLPRDLETVLLKCLAKDPGQRYPTARELADDLRRVMNGDPVKARRPGLLRRMRRWAGRRRASAALVAGAVGTTLALVLLGAFAWSAYHASGQGTVSLRVEGGTAARGEIFFGLGPDGKQVVPPFFLPTQTALELPRGWYRLRVEQPGRLSEEYQLLVEEGRHRTFTVGFNDRQLWEPRPAAGLAVGNFGMVEVANNPAAAGVLVRRLQLVPRRDGAWTSAQVEVMWETNLNRQAEQAESVFADLTEGDWQRLRDGLLSLGKHPGATAELIQPAPDLDGDRVGDLVFVVQPDFLLAVSGLKGEPLWCRRLRSGWIGHVLPSGDARPTTASDAPALLASAFAWTVPGLTVPVPPRDFGEARTRLIGPPLVVADIDGDGRPGLIVAHGVFSGEPEPRYGTMRTLRELRKLRPSVEALSGRTGATLWRHDGESQSNQDLLGEDGLGEWAQVATVAIGTAPQWPPVLLPLLLELAQSNEDRLHKSPSAPGPSDVRPRLAASNRDRVWPKYVPLPRRCASLKERPTGQGRMVLAGLYRRLECLDLHTGREVAAPLPLDGLVRGWSADGAVALVDHLFPPSGAERGINLAAVATAGGARIWDGGTNSGPVLLADLDGDGWPETVTPLGVLDGATGRQRWENRSSRTADRAVVVGPDLDGDGWRDVFVAFVVDGQPFGHPPGVRVLIAEARSGKDGRALWRSVEPLPADGPSLRPPELHGVHVVQAADDGWGDFWGRVPDLSGAGAALFWQCAPGTPGFFVVNVDFGRLGFDSDAVGRAYLFSADTGRLAHVWPDVTAEGVAYLDGDGLTDLYGRGGGKLYAVRGTPPEEWRRPGRWRVRWPCDGGGSMGRAYLTGPVPDADLFGDRVADVVLVTPGPENAPEPLLQAYSGSDGSRRWSRSPFPDAQRRQQADPTTEPGGRDRQQDFRGCTWVECLDLAGNGKPVVVFVFRTSTASGEREWTTVLEGGTGMVRWQKSFPGSPLPDLLYRQPGGRRALVFEAPSRPDGGPHRQPVGELFAVDIDGNEVGRWPRPEKEGPVLEGRSSAPLPEGIEDRFLVFHGGWPFGPLEPRGGLVDPSDGGHLVLYGPDNSRGEALGERVTVLLRDVPVNPPRETPTRSSAGEAVLNRPLPWLAPARRDWVAGVGGLAACLGVLALLAAAGRRKAALGLAAVLVLLPAFSAWFAPTAEPENDLWRLYQDEAWDWSGWYWLWPYRLGAWRDWAVCFNPLPWTLVAVAASAARRVLRRREPGKGTP
jgi:tRNA A-37 threonylcarbamoyl transferase component Bud32